MPKREEPTFLTEAEVVDRYRGAIARGTLRNWRAQRRGPPFVKVGKSVLYPLRALEAWEATRLCQGGNLVPETRPD